VAGSPSEPAATLRALHLINEKVSVDDLFAGRFGIGLAAGRPSRPRSKRLRPALLRIRGSHHRGLSAGPSLPLHHATERITSYLPAIDAAHAAPLIGNYNNLRRARPVKAARQVTKCSGVNSPA
jgi:hypothetical protein